MQTHVKILAVLFAVWGALLAVMGVFSSALFGVLAGIAGSSGEEGAAAGSVFLGLTGAMLMVFLLTCAAVSIVCAWGLFKLRPWARILAIILAAVALIRPILGTLFGIYALWALFQKQTEALFNQASPTSPPPPV